MLATLSRYAVIALAVLVVVAATPDDTFSAELAATPVLAQEDPDRQRPMTFDEILSAARQAPCQRSVQCRLSSHTPSWAKRGVFVRNPFTPVAEADPEVDEGRWQGVSLDLSSDGGTIEARYGAMNLSGQASGLAMPGEPKKAGLKFGAQITNDLNVNLGIGVAEGEGPSAKAGFDWKGKDHRFVADIDLQDLGKSSLTGYFRPTDNFSIGAGPTAQGKVGLALDWRIKG